MEYRFQDMESLWCEFATSWKDNTARSALRMMDILIPGFNVTPSTLLAMLWRVVGRAGETSTYSQSRFCPVTQWPMARDVTETSCCSTVAYAQVRTTKRLSCLTMIHCQVGSWNKMGDDYILERTITIYITIAEIQKGTTYFPSMMSCDILRYYMKLL